MMFPCIANLSELSWCRLDARPEPRRAFPAPAWPAQVCSNRDTRAHQLIARYTVASAAGGHVGPVST